MVNEVTAGQATAAGSMRTYTRNEYFLGTVHGLILPERLTGQGQGASRVSFELNIVDGWIQIREWTDDTGIVWTGESRKPSRVRLVLDAAYQHAEFIARAHLAWVTALRSAGHNRHAAAQRRALDDALARHGLQWRDAS